MSNNAIIHFKCESRMYSLLLKISVDDMTLLLMEERIYKKLRLDISKVKLRLSYYPLLVGCEEEFTICDDEDLCVYLTSMDKDNRRCVLYVEVINVSELPEQMSRVEKSSLGMNYEELQSKDVENGAQAITLYVEKENVVQEPQQEAVDDEHEVEPYLPRDVGVDISDSYDRYVEPPPVVKPSQFIEAWEDGLGFYVRQEFPSKAFLQDLVDRGAFNECFGYVVKKSDRVRLVLKCRVPSCKWSLRAAKVGETHIFSIRTYTNMHSCSRSSQSESNAKRKGTPQLVASILHDDYPRQMETPVPKIIMDLVKTKVCVDVSYSTALRGKNEDVRDLRGSSEGSYEMMYCYLYMLEKVNPGTVTCVKLDEQNKFKYLFVALGASIEGFQVMRKVLVVDATFLKNGYGGCLVFASAQDPNRHNYPIAFAILDGEKAESWTWFFEVLKTVIADSSELVFVSDRNASLIDAIANVYPQAHHGYCVWHLSQNVKGHASNVNKDTVYEKFMEMSALYTVVEFEAAYSSFKSRFPSATEYLEKTTVKEKWAKCCFPGERYNLETSNTVESLNKTFKEARRYALIPLIDAILKRLSKWFNEHRKEAVAGTDANKVVPLVENHVHDLWIKAEALIVTVLNSFELLYDVTGSDGKPYLVNMMSKSCSCRFFDIERYPCVHALAAFIKLKKDSNRPKDRDIELHELSSKYYWMELWALAYYRTIYLVPDMSEWDVPEEIRNQKILPPEKAKTRGRKRTNRFPSAGERRKKKRT